MSHHSLSPRIRKQLRLWLGACMAMVALMVLVGGLTRLTESGLSMVEWKPLHLLPPIGEVQWQEEFAKYRQYPEYQKVNHGMRLGEFQQIFWLEYIHRLLGRLVGFVFLLPLLYFAPRIPRPLAWRYATIFALGGLQGVIGWVMVKSGLQNEPWVSPVKLALHLGTAFLIFQLIFWQWLRLGNSQADNANELPWVRRALVPLITLVFLQILLGALVAGRDAGMIYNTYPTMDGQWVPDGLWALAPWWRNLVENITTIQYNHRVLAHGVLLLTILFSAALLRQAKAPLLRQATWLLLGAVLLQFFLGVMTLVLQVPIPLASAHQLGALLLLSSLVLVLYRVRGAR